jgi:hypothetical protein
VRAVDIARTNTDQSFHGAIMARFWLSGLTLRLMHMFVNTSQCILREHWTL